MSTTLRRVGFRRTVRLLRAAVVGAGLLCVPQSLSAHVDLIATTPASGATLDAAPPELRLLFSGRIEAAYTRVALVAPDGTFVPVGTVTFVPGSDREFTAALPPFSQPGTYTVQWRTAGADGHVLEGAFEFALAGDTAAALPAGRAPVPPPDEHTAPLHEHTAPGPEHHIDAGGAGVAPVMARWLHFVALVLLVGAVAFRLLLLPRLDLDAVVMLDVQRRTWRALSGAALLLGSAAVLRLWQQSAALHGADLAWNGPLLSMMLSDTAWGRAWVVQVFFFAVLAAAILRARPGHDRGALVIAAPTVLILAAIPALTGHAAGASGSTWLIVLNDALHVSAAGAWFGTLLLLLTVLPPALARTATSPARSMSHAVHRFSPVALGAAAVLVVTGVVNSLMHFTALQQLVGTTYGVALLAKLAVFAAVLAAGFYNWRFVRPRLASGDATRRLRISVAFELGFVVVVLLITAVLTGLQRPA
jgi:putative copper export protein/methionine-rich copper-binding protein CopC